MSLPSTPTTETPAASIPPMVDAAELVGELRSFAESLKAQTTATPAQTDEIAEIYQSLKATGLDDSEIQHHLTAALGVDKRVNRVVAEQIKKASDTVQQDLRSKEFKASLNRVVRQYARDDELLKEVSDSIKNKAVQTFFNGSTQAVKVARQQFNASGEVDEDVLDDIVGDIVKNIEAKRTGKKSGTPTLPATSTPGRPADAGTPGAQLDKSNLTQMQEIVYRAKFNSPMMRGVAPEEREKAALAAAARIKK